MGGFQLAQVNIALPREPIDAPLRLESLLVLWRVPSGHRPAVAEAEERMARLRAVGPSPEAFTFRRHFPPRDAVHPAPVDDERELCPA